MTFSRAFWCTGVGAAVALTVAPPAVFAEIHLSRAPIYLKNGTCEGRLTWLGGKLSIKGKDRSAWDVTNMESVDDNGLVIPACNKDQMAILCVYDRDTKKLVHPLNTRFKPCLTSLPHADLHKPFKVDAGDSVALVCQVSPNATPNQSLKVVFDIRDVHGPAPHCEPDMPEHTLEEKANTPTPDKPSASPSPDTRKATRPLGLFDRTMLHHVIDIEIVP